MPCFCYPEEPLADYVFERATIEQFIPRVTARRSVLMTLLEIASWITGGEGLSIEDFGSIFAECSRCQEFLYVDYQEGHDCSGNDPTDGSTSHNTELCEDANVSPHALVKWLIELQGTLSMQEMQIIFSMCGGCHRIVMTSVGHMHPPICSARSSYEA
ncbi:hypothetical protein NMY22_g18029 [Coprinellus aureogranulatus]|nr:hypothetical protein NMY22_g18029 [Coprinellus aureogranulatus]